VDTCSRTARPSVLVTGSSGFVGVHMSQILAQRGWRVTAVSRDEHLGTPVAGVDRVSLSLASNSGDWQKALKSVQVVVHLAAHAHQLRTAATTAGLFQQVNVDGSRFVAEQAARAGVGRFVFLSSIKVNGEGSGDQAFRADDAPRPHDAYARSKWQAELLLGDISRATGMELVIIRPPLVYGAGVRANFYRLLRLAELGVPLPLRAIDNRRSLVGVWNLVDFVETCMQHTAAAGHTWLVSDGDDLSTPALVGKLANLMHRRARMFSVSPRLLRFAANMVGHGEEIDRLCGSLQIDATPALERLQWRPPMSVDECLARTVAWYTALRQ
jgi:nucleoside-diphosphate-sugar epimerase